MLVFLRVYQCCWEWWCWWPVWTCSSSPSSIFDEWSSCYGSSRNIKPFNRNKEINYRIIWECSHRVINGMRRDKKYTSKWCKNIRSYIILQASFYFLYIPPKIMIKVDYLTPDDILPIFEELIILLLNRWYLRVIGRSRGSTSTSATKTTTPGK